MPSLTLPLLSLALAASPSAPSHVFVIVLENHGLGDVIGNPDMPFLNALARQYGLATNYTGVAHPSLPNYVALLFGSTFASRSDDPRQRFEGDNLALQLERANRTWKGYMQGLPRAGWDGSSAGEYAKKHDPFMLSAEIARDSRQAANVVPPAQLERDLNTGNAPDFALIVPDLCHDLHGAPECPRGAKLDRAGDAFVKAWADKITQSGAWTGNAALIVTFDEGGDLAGGGGKIATIVATPHGPRGLTSSAPYNHYSLLRTLEDTWNLPPLREAAGAKPMNDLFGW